MTKLLSAAATAPVRGLSAALQAAPITARGLSAKTRPSLAAPGQPTGRGPALAGPLSPRMPISNFPARALERGTLARMEAALPDIYTQLEAPEHRRAHARHQDDLTEVIRELRSGKPFADAVAYRRAMAEAVKAQAVQQGRLDEVQGPLTFDNTVRADSLARLGEDGEYINAELAFHLPVLLKSIGFDASIYSPRSQDQHGYGRYLFQSDPLYTMQGFAFGAHQETPVHPHPTLCASYIARGQLRESLYAHTDDAELVGGQRAVRLLKVNVRPLGSLAGFGKHQLATPHALANAESSPAFSFHHYPAFDGVSPGQQVAALGRYAVMPD